MPAKSTPAPANGQPRVQRPNRIVDLSGQKFGMLVVQGLVPERSTQGHVLWMCICDCGTIKNIMGSNLKRGLSQSCGCQVTVALRARKGEKRTHGYSNSWVQRVWYGMINRCYDPTNNAYARYGGRGIRVCERWKNSIEAFHEDMGDRPSPKHQIDRWPNNDGDYEPENCRWATPKEQANNRSSSRVIEFRGETRTLMQWAESIGIDHASLIGRLNRGWPLEEALTMSPGKPGRWSRLPAKTAERIEP